jgi:hypothetical protein
MLENGTRATIAESADGRHPHCGAHRPPAGIARRFDAFAALTFSRISDDIDKCCVNPLEKDDALRSRKL